MNIRSRLSSSPRGQSFVELLGGVAFLVPLILALLDFGIIIMAVQVNDSACRDAARAAAAGTPQDFTPDGGTTRPADVQTRAEAAVNKAFKNGGYIEKPADNVKVTLVNVQPPDTKLGGPWLGSIEVKSDIIVHLPVAIPNVTPSTLAFTSRQRFPCTRVEEPTIVPF